jgi:ankyrin repeat protein
MIELLLAHGADPTIANDDGKTPAMIAGEKGYTEIVALLEREAAKP